MVEGAWPISPLLAGTVLIANLAAFWYIRRTFFRQNDEKKSSGLACCPSQKKDFILDIEEWNEFELIEKRQVSPNSSIYRFKLPSSDAVLPLPIGQHVQLCANWDGKEVIRSYTPITLDDHRGYFELLIKTYPAGNASRYVDSLFLGDHARFRGPKGRFLYRPNMAREVGMIAGGTGITPTYQVIQAILRNPEDQTKISLIFGNITEADILLRSELEELASKHPNKFKVHFVLNEFSEGWKGSTGYINAEIISAHCPAPSDDVRILMCGPPPMMSAMTKVLTEELGFKPQSSPPSPEDQVQRF